MCHAAPRRAKQSGLAEPGAALPDGAMRVACPACGTEYEAPDQAAGRTLVCAVCGHVFRAAGGAPPVQQDRPPIAPESPDGNAAATPLPELSKIVPADEAAAPAPDRSQALAAAPPSAAGLSTAPRIAWGASVVLLVVAGIALHAFRGEIAEAWPPMLRLYRALGLL
jgi:rubredoxin